MLNTVNIPRLDQLAPLLTSVGAAASAMGRLDQALGSHPLAQAWLHRMRLEAVRRQAAVDGDLIDQWHLAATLEGLRLRMDPYLRIIDRAVILDKAKVALGYHQWLVEPDFDQEGEVQRAEAVLAKQPLSLPPVLAAAIGIREWIEGGGGRAPMRAASMRFWRQRSVLRKALPLTGAAAFSSDRAWDWGSWVPAYLNALQSEAEDGLNLLYTLERAWFEARRGAAGRRKTSHAARAIDLLAAAPMMSATTLAQILGIAIKNVLRILEDLVAADLAVEVTHRSKRRLFGLKGVTPIRDVVRPPYRPEPGRGRGRPRHDGDIVMEEPSPSLAEPLTPLEFRAFDYTALDEAMAHLDNVVRDVRRNLGALTSAIRDRSSEATSIAQGAP